MVESWLVVQGWPILCTLVAVSKTRPQVLPTECILDERLFNVRSPDSTKNLTDPSFGLRHDYLEIGERDSCILTCLCFTFGTFFHTLDKNEVVSVNLSHLSLQHCSVKLVAGYFGIKMLMVALWNINWPGSPPFLLSLNSPLRRKVQH